MQNSYMEHLSRNSINLVYCKWSEECVFNMRTRRPRHSCFYIPMIPHCVEWFLLLLLSQFWLSEYYCQLFSLSGSFSVFLNYFPAAILDDPMECSRGERLAITLAKESINRSSNRSTTGKLELDIFELLRDSEFETGETSEYSYIITFQRSAQ